MENNLDKCPYSAWEFVQTAEVLEWIMENKKLESTTLFEIKSMIQECRNIAHKKLSLKND